MGSASWNGSRLPMPTTESIFARYEEVRPRLPVNATRPGFRDIGSLLDIADQASAFVFDAFGVLNVGETLIEGADVRLDELRGRGCQIRILTNAASYDRSGAIQKFQRLGVRVEDSEIITSRDATLASVTPGVWGVVAAREDDLIDLTVETIRLEENETDYDRVSGFVFLSSSGWTERRQMILASSLARNQRPVLIANADLAAPRDDAFSLEPGHFGHSLADAGIADVRFFGKPFTDVYRLVEQSLPTTPANRIVMCGDSLHTDILGAAARGWRSVLVTKDGLFAGHATEDYCHRSGIFPDWRVARI